MEKKYDASSIQVLEGLEAVRKRPGMYIGDTGSNGLHQCVWEAVDNAIDEAMAGHANKIDVVLHKDNSISVKDNGRGIPVDIVEGTGKPGLEVVMTILHAGGKFDSNTYKVSAGLHGVGISAVNAVSEKLIARTIRDKFVHEQTYKCGKPTGPVTKKEPSKDKGTFIHFFPDPTIFTNISFDIKIIARRLKELAYLNKNIEITLANEFSGKSIVYKFEGGIKDFVSSLNKEKKVLHEPIFTSFEKDKVQVEVAFQYTDTDSEIVHCYANSINNRDGGTHLSGFRRALTKAFGDFAQANELVPKGIELTGPDFREGLTLALSVKLPEPQFESQTKVKLTTPYIEGLIGSALEPILTKIFNEKFETTSKILERVVLAAKMRAAAKKAREAVKRQTIMSGTELTGKLSDCQDKQREGTELFIVEGDSAGGSAKMGRQRKFQAVLPIKGKVLNVEKANISKLFDHAELMTLISAIGVDPKKPDLDKLRYDKVIIMTDADIDGAHIRTLLLTFFYKYLRILIENGNIYVAQPPLFSLSIGSQTRYVLNEKEFESGLLKLGSEFTTATVKNKQVDLKAILKALKAKDEKFLKGFGTNEIAFEFKKQVVNTTFDKLRSELIKLYRVGIEVGRYKGLGEMDADVLADTTMDPALRTLKKITIQDAAEAEHLISILMGSDVEQRRNFIYENALNVKNLDV